MNKRLFVPQQTLADQGRAADPHNSVWVSANAGSGKTHVLSRRVIRLLLRGVNPSRILCLTYTRAAAANMVNKVFEDLGQWAVMDDAGLVEAVTELEGKQPDATRLALARQLFSRALETPGGLKIQTIHAFCEAVLHQFPLEANIAGHFDLLDAQMEQALVAQARRELIAGAGGGREDLAQAFALVLATAGEHGLDALLADIVNNRELVRNLLRQIAGGGDQLALLREEFGLNPGDSEETVVASVWPDSYFNEDTAASLRHRAEQAGKAKGAEFAAKLEAACKQQDPAVKFQCLCDVFLRVDRGHWIARSARGLAAKGVGEYFPDFDIEFARFAELLLIARDSLATLRSVEATNAALTVADHLIERYEQLKHGRGYLDFNDLISRTVNLLARQDAGPWVQYKLDRGLDHILIDEAQDTSPGQWQVVRRLAEEFFSGKSARSEAERTIFAVGDEKQSIYSFQGAEPAAFAETGLHFAGKIEAAESRFAKVKLHHSFRSVGDVLSAVDLVFEPEAAREGLTLYPEPISHSPIRAGDPGYVELWPMIGADKAAEPEDWTEAIDHASQPAVRLAEAIAAHIKNWISEAEVIEGAGKHVTPGDIMVLVRKRDSFVHALSRALKMRHVAVAGADRLRLRDHIAVKDLIAIGRVAIQPNDDLSLAALLKSPVFGLSEDDLFKLAHDRGESASLWDALIGAAAQDRRFEPVLEKMTKWRKEAGVRPVVEFYHGVLGRDGVRSAMIARLGNEAGEILDEFTNFAFGCEQVGINGLGSFLETLDSAGPEIKREISQTRDEVRIMTVHAAKGLEAPIVFLVDNGSAPFSASHLPRLLRFQPTRDLWQGPGILWRADSRLRTAFGRGLEATERKKAEDEYRRLLYVGMTRAEDRLIVCGYHGVQAPKEGTWHRLVSDALAPVSELVEANPAHFDEPIHRYRSTEAKPGSTGAGTQAAARSVERFPAALRQPLPADTALPRPFTPSGAATLVEPQIEMADNAVSPVLQERAKPSFAIERGTAIHRLLQFLPDIEAEKRVDLAKRYLGRYGMNWPEGEREIALDAVMQILSDERFSGVFAKGSRAEVAIAGHLKVAGMERAVSGKIDRLALGDDHVLLVDYKTNRAPPRNFGQIPRGYIAQVAVYTALLKQVYPDRKVSAGLLFTEIPQMFEIPETVIAETLERLAVS